MNAKKSRLPQYVRQNKKSKYEEDVDEKFYDNVLNLLRTNDTYKPTSMDPNQHVRTKIILLMTVLVGCITFLFGGCIQHPYL